MTEPSPEAVDRAYAKLTEKAQRSRQVWSFGYFDSCELAEALARITGDGGYVFQVNTLPDDQHVVIWWRWED